MHWFDADEQSGVSDRDQFVGLAGDFGKVRFGTISTSYKSHGAMIDPPVSFFASASVTGAGGVNMKMVLPA